MSRKSRKTIEALDTAIDGGSIDEAELAELDVATEALDEAEAEVVTRSVVPRKWRNVYNHNALKGTCNDQLAHDLKAALVDSNLQALGELNAIDVSARWGARNPGMRRMNLGNVLRNRIKRGEEVHLS